MKKVFIASYVILLLLSCSNTKNTPVIKNSNKADIQKSSDFKNLQQSGVDFLAQGNEPSNWRLTIDYDDTVRFTADDGLALKFAFNQLKKDINRERQFYTVELKSGNVKIEIYEKICTVATIREVFKRQVNVTFNSITYVGCGKFLADNNLQGKWVLEKIGTTSIIPNEYNKVPEINLDIIEGSMSGNNGCNSIGGKIEVQGKRIQFANLLMTKMACNKKSIDKIIAGQITGQLVSYYFKDGKLFLYLPDDSLLVFKRT